MKDDEASSQPIPNHPGDQGYPGKHEPLTDRATWDRVQTLLGGHVYQAHEMTYASERIICGDCGHPITGERKTKKTKTGERHYVYYRCTDYNIAGHPRTRVTDRRWTFPNDLMGSGLLHCAIAQVLEFSADMFFEQAKKVC